MDMEDKLFERVCASFCAHIWKYNARLVRSGCVNGCICRSTYLHVLTGVIVWGVGARCEIVGVIDVDVSIGEFLH